MGRDQRGGCPLVARGDVVERLRAQRCELIAEGAEMEMPIWLGRIPESVGLAFTACRDVPAALMAARTRSLLLGVPALPVSASLSRCWLP